MDDKDNTREVKRVSERHKIIAKVMPSDQVDQDDQTIVLRVFDGSVVDLPASASDLKNYVCNDLFHDLEEINKRSINSVQLLEAQVAKELYDDVVSRSRMTFTVTNPDRKVEVAIAVPVF